MLFAGVFTFIPLFVPITFVSLWYEDLAGAKISRVVIQALTAVPLAYTFRERTWRFVSTFVDLVHGGGVQQEQTRLYKLFLFIRHGSTKGQTNRGSFYRFSLSAIELLGLILLVTYFIGGLVIRNYG